MNPREEDGVAWLLEALTRRGNYQESCREVVRAICTIAETPFAGLFSYARPRQMAWVNHNGPHNLLNAVSAYGPKYPARNYILSEWKELTAFKPVDVVGRQRWRNSEFYTDFMKAHGFDDHALIFSPINGESRWLLALCHDGQNAISKQKVRLFERLMPHISRGLENLQSANGIDGAEGSRLGLSAREREIVLLMAEGLANKEIARELHISYHTARTHAQNIFAKLNVSGRIEAVNRLRRHGADEMKSHSS